MRYNGDFPSGTLQVLPVIKKFEEEAKLLILDGLLERFGFIDHSLNPDLDDIMIHFNKEGNIFLIALVNKELVATGALTKESERVGRVERMSVKRQYRRQGVGKRILQSIESYARSLDYTKLVLETNNNWESALHFYSINGYHSYLNDGQRTHLEKSISERGL